jgi:molybdopterin synthase sulfur carrier subunit
MRVNFYATLRQIVGSKTLEVDIPDGFTVGGLVDKVIALYPAMRRELMDEQGQLYRHVHIFVNGRDAPYLDNMLDTVLKPDDTVNIFPAVGGG